MGVSSFFDEGFLNEDFSYEHRGDYLVPSEESAVILKTTHAFLYD